jgi:hypothetical protein
MQTRAEIISQSLTVGCLNVDLHLKLTHPGWFILRVWVVDKSVSFSPFSVGLNSL